MIFDSDVLIASLRNGDKATRTIDDDEERSVSVVTKLELVHGARNRVDLTLVQRFLGSFEIVPLAESIGLRAALLMEQWVLKVRLDPFDALIAATAIERALPLCTGNVKHYRHIPELVLVPFRP